MNIILRVFSLSFVIICLLWISGCAIFKASDEKEKIEFPKIENMRDVIDNHMKKVIVEGIYTQVDVRLRRQDPDVRYTGHVSLKLEDKTQVFIFPPTSQEAIRPRREIRDMEGQEVRAIGVIYKHMPQSDAIQNKFPQHVVASPYLTFIESVELVNPPVDTRRRR